MHRGYLKCKTSGKRTHMISSTKEGVAPLRRQTVTVTFDQSVKFDF